MQFLVLGAGAIGAYIGATLGRSGQWVTLVGRKPFVDAANQNGIQMQLPDGRSWQTTNFRAVNTVQEAGLSHGMYQPPYDVVLICVKAYSVDATLSELQVHRAAICVAEAAKTRFVCFQNGVGSEERLAEVFGQSQVWAGTTTSPVLVPQVGQIQVARAGGTVCMAPVDGDVAGGAPMVERMREAFWGIRTYPDARALKWSKLLLNMMGNATSAILGLTPGAIYAHPALYKLEMQALREAIQVMQAQHIQPVNLPHYPAATLAKALRWLPERALQPILQKQLAQGRGSKWPSFYYDVQGKTGHCEVNWLNGAVVKYGQQLGIKTPANQRLTHVLTRIISGEDEAAGWQGQAARLANMNEQEA
jgi:2-dehydropantoate 2-reductase